MSLRRFARRSRGSVAITTELRTRSAEETEAAGGRLGAGLGPGDVVGLVGELGAGKTCFIQGLVRGLGATTRATSPTFVLVNQYRGRVPIYHVDAYRTQSLVELLDLGVAELLQGDGVTVVEWADKLLPLLPSGTIEVRIEGLGDEPRTITIRRLDRTRSARARRASASPFPWGQPSDHLGIQAAPAVRTAARVRLDVLGAIGTGRHLVVVSPRHWHRRQREQGDHGRHEQRNEDPHQAAPALLAD